MHALIYGTGAVGGYFGARLAQGGHEVTLVARGATLDTLRRDGLTLDLGDARHVLRLPATDDPSQAPAADVVLVCVKSYDTLAAAAALRAVVRPDTIVLSLQNGIENEDLLAAALGVPPLMIGLTRIGVAMPTPGVVLYSGRGTIIYGEPDGTRSPRAERLARWLDDSGVPYDLRRDIRVSAWEKLAWNAAFNAVTTITDTTVAQALDHPASRTLIAQAMEEVDAVATALGVPVRRWRTRAVLEESRSGLPDFPTSMLQDRRRGRRLEHDAINGAVVRAAARAGVAVPTQRLLVALLETIDAHRRC